MPGIIISNYMSSGFLLVFLQETKLRGHKLKLVVYKSKKAAKIVTMQEEGSEFEQTIAFLELQTQEIEDEVQNSLEEV